MKPHEKISDVKIDLKLNCNHSILLIHVLPSHHLAVCHAVHSLFASPTSQIPQHCQAQQKAFPSNFI